MPWPNKYAWHCFTLPFLTSFSWIQYNIMTSITSLQYLIMRQWIAYWYPAKFQGSVGSAHTTTIKHRWRWPCLREGLAQCPYTANAWVKARTSTLRVTGRALYSFWLKDGRHAEIKRIWTYITSSHNMQLYCTQQGLAVYTKRRCCLCFQPCVHRAAFTAPVRLRIRALVTRATPAHRVTQSPVKGVASTDSVSCPTSVAVPQDGRARTAPSVSLVIKRSSTNEML